ncbi:MAG: hypothetical protein IKB20_01325 [Clostridia bacterium]|nr:hypothetical protein [Clostridia bacterium]
MKKFLVALMAALTCFACVACAPTSVEKAEEKMQKAGYTVVAYSDKEAEGLVGGFVASNGILTGDSMTALLFETKDDATDFYSNVDDLGATLDGKWVYWGDEEAIKEFTKLF